MSKAMKLKMTIARDIVNKYEEPIDGWSFVAEQEGDEGRWERHMLTVLRGPDGNTYGFNWSSGLTENQDDYYPWGYSYEIPEGGAEIDVFPVQSKIVTTVVWEKV